MTNAKISLHLTSTEVLESCDGNQGRNSKRVTQNKQKGHQSTPKSRQSLLQSNQKVTPK